MTYSKGLSHRNRPRGDGRSISKSQGEIGRAVGRFLNQKQNSAKITRAGGLSYGQGSLLRRRASAPGEKEGLRDTASFTVYYTKKDTGGLLNSEEGRELAGRATTVRTSGGSCSIPSQASDPLGLPASDSWKLAAGVTFRNWGQGGRSVNFQIRQGNRVGKWLPDFYFLISKATTLTVQPNLEVLLYLPGHVKTISKKLAVSAVRGHI